MPVKKRKSAGTAVKSEHRLARLRRKGYPVKRGKYESRVVLSEGKFTAAVEPKVTAAERRQARMSAPVGKRVHKTEQVKRFKRKRAGGK